MGCTPSFRRLLPKDAPSRLTQPSPALGGRAPASRRKAAVRAFMDRRFRAPVAAASRWVAAETPDSLPPCTAVAALARKRRWTCLRAAADDVNAPEGHWTRPARRRAGRSAESWRPLRLAALQWLAGRRNGPALRLCIRFQACGSRRLSWLREQPMPVLFMPHHVHRAHGTSSLTRPPPLREKPRQA